MAATTSPVDTPTNDVLRSGSTIGPRKFEALREIGIAAAVGLLSMVAGVLSLRISPTDLTQRWTSGATGDMALHYLVAASARDGSLFSPNSALGFPTNQNMFFAPMFDFASAAMLSVEALFVSDPVVMLNVYQVLGFFFTGFAGYALFRALRVRMSLRIVFALVFSLMPYHFERVALGHAFVANYWGVALLGILILMSAGAPVDPLAGWVARGRSAAARRARRILPIVTMTFLLSLTNSYYFVFACIVLGGVLLFRAIALLIERRGLRELLLPAATLATLVGFIGVQLAALSLNFDDRYEKYFSERLATASEQHAGKLTSLLLPWPGTGVAPLADLAREYQKTTIISPTAEPTGTPLLASIAMLLILIFLLARVFATRQQPTTAMGRFLVDGRATLISVAFLWSLMFFLVGGLGFIFAALISPEIRSWVRFSVILSTLALMFLAVLIDTLPHRRSASVAAAFAVCTIAFVDQISGASAAAALQPSDDAPLRAAVAEANQSFDPGCGIVQLPFKGFPESGAIKSMGDYDEALPYIFSDTNTLRWSYGAVSGTYSADFWKASETSFIETPDAFAQAVRASEACGILVDQFAYDGDATVWAPLVDSVSDSTTPVVESRDPAHRYLFFKVDAG
ncbi:hypothetical protein HQQ80_05760 [Microbacteriaceae bacterium VKM Ac-2855]|nr:hypothetical protein [Microbacteriaceae bacterium VKM Ac-2855]